MKNIYVMVDDIKQEECDVFLANNRKEALLIANEAMQRVRANLEFSLYEICSTYVDDMKENENLIVDYDRTKIQRIWSFPKDLIVYKSKEQLENEINESARIIEKSEKEE